MKGILTNTFFFLSLQAIVSNGNQARNRSFRRPPSFTKQSSTDASTEIPWHSDAYLSKKDWDNLRRYQRAPPSQFAPGGRLHSVEKVMEALSSEEDPTSNLVIALQCQDGIVVVSHGVTPPNAALFLPKPENTTGINATATTSSNGDPSSIQSSSSLWLDFPEEKASVSASPWSHSSSCIVPIPFSENENIFAVTAGNAIHSQVLRHLVRRMAESLYIANDDGLFQPSRVVARKGLSAAMLARRLADHFQKPTQALSAGRMMASSALIVGVEEGIWQIDPTGQFWECQVAVVGKGATKVRALILEKMASEIRGENSTDTDNNQATNAELHEFMNQLSIQDAIKLACGCLHQPTPESKSSNRNETNATALPSFKPPVLAFSIQETATGKQKVLWYTPKDLLGSDLSVAKAKTA